LVHGEKDEELAKLIIAARMLFGYDDSVEAELITDDLSKAYKLGFMRGFELGHKWRCLGYSRTTTMTYDDDDERGRR
jgi:hypothetical protein